MNTDATTMIVSVNRRRPAKERSQVSARGARIS